MANSPEQICNMALSHVGHTQFIDSLENERSNEASVCNLHYVPSRDFVLQVFPWPEATKYATLGLVEETPNDDWLFSYRYPSDCLFVRRVSTVLGRATPDPPPFITAADDIGRVIYTNQENAKIEYTKRLVDTAQFSESLTQALAWYLAAMICPGLSKQPKQADYAMRMFVVFSGMARSTSLNEQQQQAEPESEFMRARQ